MGRRTSASGIPGYTGREEDPQEEGKQEDIRVRRIWVCTRLPSDSRDPPR